MSYTNPHPDLPPLQPLAAVPADAAPATSDKMTRSAIVAIVALAVAMAAIGWGFTQWMSARDWRHRSQTVEHTFSELQTRATTAENQRTAAQLAAERARTQLINTQGKLANVSNQYAYTKDTREVLCKYLTEIVTAQDRARICP